ncbi:hypothetical protein ACFZB9_07435 [Kitasatospora sp. NPDC008050]|uniref:hypothetical protein n=1 Tax=Kitasatospora sp. NPDC008050 TaxID=3364021 RepID=UPI0036EFFA23
MRVKLRPDAHCAPVPQGIHWSRGERSFVLSGPPALFTVVDDQLGALLDGTSVDEMVAATGDERSRPVLDHIVRALVAQDVLIDLDAVDGPLPDRRSAKEHAALLGYLESNCAEPYRAFAAVRAARVAVVGAGPGADAVRRGLAANGTGETTELSASSGHAASPTVVVLIDDVDAPLDLLAASSLLAPGTPVVPVAAGPALALVGPVCTGPAQLRAFSAVRARATDWQLTGVDSAAPRPISAVLAGSLAAQCVLAHLAGIEDGARTAVVVHGHAVQTTPVPVPEAEPGPAWRPLDPAEVLGEPAERPDPDPAAPASTDAPASADAREFQLDAALTARWTGLARWGRDLDLPQLPVSLVTAQLVPGPGPSAATPSEALGPHVLGWGENRAAAGLTAVLTVLRRRAAEERPEKLTEEWPGEWAGESTKEWARESTEEWAGQGNAGLIPAAGLTPAHLLVDGLLRQAGQDALARPAGAPLAWEDVEGITARTLWGLLRDFFGVPAALRPHTATGLDWQLVSVTDELTGEVLATQWGPRLASAGYAALFAATAHAQFQAAARTAPQAPVLPPDPVGTWALESASDRQVHDCLRQLLARAQAMGLHPRAQQLFHDASAGELAPACGWVTLV